MNQELTQTSTHKCTHFGHDGLQLDGVLAVKFEQLNVSLMSLVFQLLRFVVALLHPLDIKSAVLLQTTFKGPDHSIAPDPLGKARKEKKRKEKKWRGPLHFPFHTLKKKQSVTSDPDPGFGYQKSAGLV